MGIKKSKNASVKYVKADLVLNFKGLISKILANLEKKEA